MDFLNSAKKIWKLIKQYWNSLFSRRQRHPGLHAEECVDGHIFKEDTKPETTTLHPLRRLLRLLSCLPETFR
ncbi:mCG142061 [Mus musculus]|nr:mCG142061 [Mus musculus]